MTKKKGNNEVRRAPVEAHGRVTEPLLGGGVAHAQDPHAQWTEVTPALADQWLQRNTRNRPPRPGVIDRYAADMKAERWLQTGDAIRIASDGTVLDGQHRLHAIVKSATTQRMLVVTNVAHVAQRVMDRGPRRVLADDYRIAGKPFAKDLASWVRNIHLFERGTSEQLSLDHQERIETHHAAGLEWGATIVTDNRAIRRAPIIAALIYAHAVDPARVNEFALAFKNGANLAAGAPALVLRNYAMIRLPEFREEPFEIMSKTLRCVHAHLKGRALGASLRRGDEVNHFFRCFHAEQV